MKLFRRKKRGSQAKKRRFRFHWWYIPAAAVFLTAAFCLMVWARVNSLQHNTKYVATWNQAINEASSGSSSSPSSSSVPEYSDDGDETGLDALDADDFDKVQRKDYPIIKVKRKDPDIENILLIGIDGGDPGGVGQNRADSMIVASVNTRTGTLKLTSLMRDTKTYFPNTGTWHKLNAAYSYGGPGLQIDVINYAYQLDIQKYIQFDFAGFQQIVDTIGGVSVKLTAQEATYSYINAGTSAGTYLLDGAQALGYARTRKIDTDFQRTERQRTIIQAIYNKYKDAGMQQKINTVNLCMGDIETNVSSAEIFGKLLPFESKMSSDIRQLEVPAEDDGMYTTETSPIWYWDLDWGREVPKLQNFIYGNG